MMPKSDQEHIAICLALIEDRLGWGAARRWNSYDFDRLTELILDKTGERLSHTTLKRIWGVLPYQSKPNTQTLNVLAAFLDYDSWTEFVARQNAQVTVDSSEKTVDGSSSNGSKQSRIRKTLIGGVALGTIAFLAITIGFGIGDSPVLLTPEEISDVSFYSEPVTTGLPNTVIFHYDLGSVTSQNLKLQQNWDERRQAVIDPASSVVSSTYFYPGYWRAKLLIEDQIVREHDLLIASDGWLATIETEPRPRYINDEMVVDGTFHPSADLDIGLHSPNDLPEWMSYHYFKEFGELSGDQFTLEASIRNTYSAGNSKCQDTRIYVIATEGFMLIPFSIPGCVGDLRLVASDMAILGSEADMSAFGCDFARPVEVRIAVRAKEVSISLNDRMAYQFAYSESMGLIKGIRFKFRGSGEIDDVRLRDDQGTLVFDEKFDSPEQN